MNIEAEKLSLIQWLAQLTDKDVIARIKSLRGEGGFVLSEEQKLILDEEKARYERSEGSSLSWEEVKQKARKALD